MHNLLNQHSLIMMEAAIVEPLRRGGVVSLDPCLVHGGLIYDEVGRDELKRLYHQYANIAIECDLPFLMCTPTWRTNQDRVKQAGVNENVNRDAAGFLLEIRDELDSEMIKVGGLVGCKNDCYQPAESLTADEAESFHSWQIEQLVEGGVDFLDAVTLPCIDEAIGIARAMAKTATPYFISFVIDRTGSMLDGTSLADAIKSIDEGTQRPPIGYMISCAWPTFLCADQQPEELFSRLIGFQANASSLDHSELDCADELRMNRVDEWGHEMLSLHVDYGIQILGGCCGTNSDHLHYIADHANSRNQKHGGQ